MLVYKYCTFVKKHKYTSVYKTPEDCTVNQYKSQVYHLVSFNYTLMAISNDVHVILQYVDYIRLVVLTIFYVTIIYLMKTGITLINFYTPLNVPLQGIN